MFLPFLWFSFSLYIHGTPPLGIRQGLFLWVDPASFFLYLVAHQSPCSDPHPLCHRILTTRNTQFKLTSMNPTFLQSMFTLSQNLTISVLNSVFPIYLPWNGLSPPKKSLNTFSAFPWNVYPCVQAPASPLPWGTPFFKPSSPNWSYVALFRAIWKH